MYSILACKCGGKYYMYVVKLKKDNHLVDYFVVCLVYIQIFYMVVLQSRIFYIILKKFWWAFLKRVFFYLPNCTTRIIINSNKKSSFWLVVINIYLPKNVGSFLAKMDIAGLVTT